MERQNALTRIFALRSASNRTLITALAGLDVTWMILPQSVLAFSPAPYDIYVFDTEAGWKDASAIYQWMRARERNAPAIFICDTNNSHEIREKMRGDPFSYMVDGASPFGLRQVVDHLAKTLENRATLARSEEVLAAGVALKEMLVEASDQAQKMRHQLGYAQERLIRAKALLAFTTGGGTAAQFERLWPEVFEEVLQGKSYQ